MNWKQHAPLVGCTLVVIATMIGCAWWITERAAESGEYSWELRNIAADVSAQRHVVESLDKRVAEIDKALNASAERQLRQDILNLARDRHR